MMAGSLKKQRMCQEITNFKLKIKFILAMYKINKVSVQRGTLDIFMR